MRPSKILPKPGQLCPAEYKDIEEMLVDALINVDHMMSALDLESGTVNHDYVRSSVFEIALLANHDSGLADSS